MSALDGPRRPPASGGPAKALVVFLHGYGADGEDLIGLADMFVPAAPDLADVAFFAPHAPQQMSMGGRAWFPLTMRDPSEYVRGVEAAGPALQSALDAELSNLGLANRDLILVGFSQGTMMALHVAYRRQGPIAGVVGFSGLCAGAGEGFQPAPTLLVHGTDDQVLPAALTPQAAQILGEAGVSVEWHLVPGLGHGIDQTGLALALQHLSLCLPHK